VRWGGRVQVGGVGFGGMGVGRSPMGGDTGNGLIPLVARNASLYKHWLQHLI
jgi:hypothetical protein